MGVTGKNQVSEARFWSFDNPVSKGYAYFQGGPAENINIVKFIETATLKVSTSLVTSVYPKKIINS